MTGPVDAEGKKKTQREAKILKNLRQSGSTASAVHTIPIVSQQGGRRGTCKDANEPKAGLEWTPISLLPPPYSSNHILFFLIFILYWSIVD